MAVAACFGGPVLNLLLATGVPVLVQNAKMGTLPFKLSNGITILFACSMVRHTSKLTALYQMSQIQANAQHKRPPIEQKHNIQANAPMSAFMSRSLRIPIRVTPA